VFFVIQGPAFTADKFDKTGTKELNKEAKTEKWWAFAGFLMCLVGFAAYLRQQIKNASADGYTGASKQLEAKINAARIKAIDGGVANLKGIMTQVMQHAEDALSPREPEIDEKGTPLTRKGR
jgi:hypothetical protein